MNVKSYFCLIHFIINTVAERNDHIKVCVITVEKERVNNENDYKN